MHPVGGIALLALLMNVTSAFGQIESFKQPVQDPLHAWVQAKDPKALEKWTIERLNQEKADLARLLAVTGKRTVENTLRPYDDAQNQLTIAHQNAQLLNNLADSAEMEEEAGVMIARISGAREDLRLSPAVYGALKAIKTPPHDKATRHYLERTLLEYKLGGVDRGEGPRERIRNLEGFIRDRSMAFASVIHNERATVTATREELDGLPADFIARHVGSADGKYTLTTDEPDFQPVMAFARNADLRRRMFLAYYGRGYPRNEQILRDLLKARHELAVILGFAHSSGLATADQMIGTAGNVDRLLQELDDLSRPAANREYAELLAFAQGKEPWRKEISQSDSSYWVSRYRSEELGFDAGSLRPYFPYEGVRAGVLQAMARLFHVEFRAITDSPAWDKSVEIFDVLDRAPHGKSRRLGRIYLDMHPREGKDNWYYTRPLVPGIRGRQIPEALLDCNFPGGQAGDPGLMEYGQVVIFLHEFGHLMHFILSGRVQWSGENGAHVEKDFVEALSQMPEEMFYQADTLQLLARNYKTGEAIPASHIAKMRAADAFGRGAWLRDQLMLSSLALDIYNQDPEGIDMKTTWVVNAKRFDPFAPVSGAHPITSLTYLIDPGPKSYMYAMDKVIAVELFAQFDKRTPLDGPKTMRYRRAVLEPGAGKAAAELVKDFLGRPQNLAALKNWLNEEFQPAASPGK